MLGAIVLGGEFVCVQPQRVLAVTPEGSVRLAVDLPAGFEGRGLSATKGKLWVHGTDELVVFPLT